MPQRVHPQEPMQSNASIGQIIKRRAKNVSKFVIVTLSVPLHYTILPFSCCIIQPTLHITNPAMVQEALRAGEEAKDSKGFTKFTINTTGMVQSMLSVLTVGCCCFGCCGEVSPDVAF
jgi:hypothetical protein